MTDHYISPETRAKISNTLMGHSVSNETRLKISLINTGRHFYNRVGPRGKESHCYGKHPSPETRAKMSAWVRAPEMRAKMKDAWTRRGPVSEETRAKLRAVARRGDRNPNWKGGKTVRTGYEAIRVCDKFYLTIHRLVMAKLLGRKLKNGEIVHHINGNKKDNRPENLALCSDPSAHKLCHSEEARIFFGL